MATLCLVKFSQSHSSYFYIKFRKEAISLAKQYSKTKMAASDSLSSVILLKSSKII